MRSASYYPPCHRQSSSRASRRAGTVEAMMQNLVIGFVLVALIVMGVIAYAQKHEGCLHGRSLQTFQPCGSISVDI
jgi:hypothetical protein